MTEVHIGRNIRAIRLLLGIKQEVFARKIGVSQQNISRLESREKVSPSKLTVVSKALGVSAGAIEAFDENVVLGAGPYLSSRSNNGEVNEMIAYFKDEIAKRDLIIDKLKVESTLLRSR